MKYKLYFAHRSGETREASSMREAIATARRILGAGRVYRGARYSTDEPIEGSDGRRMVDALDVWTSRKSARIEQGVPADCVIAWEVR